MLKTMFNINSWKHKYTFNSDSTEWMLLFIELNIVIVP